MLSEANMNSPTCSSDACVRSYGFPLSNQQCMGQEDVYILIAVVKRDRSRKFQNIMSAPITFGRHCRIIHSLFISIQCTLTSCAVEIAVMNLKTECNLEV